MSETPTFSLHRGTLPLLISVPHDGRELPPEMAAQMTPAARKLPDTDWHVALLYDFARDLGASLLTANFSRYVVDLNRPAEDSALYPGQVSTGLCPEMTFAGEAIYSAAAGVDEAQRGARLQTYWRPYHDCIEKTLAELVDEHGFALLWDAHSIASVVPRLFDGELTELNVGTNDGKSCPHEVARAITQVAKDSAYSSVLNGRFRGGYITRRYGMPDARRYAVQLELAQRCYMDEGTLRYDRERAAKLRDTLKRMLMAYLTSARRVRGEPA